MAQLGQPPALSAVPVIVSPVPVQGSLLTNARDRAIGNGTFVLNTTTTTPPGDSLVMPLHRVPASSAIISIEAAAGTPHGIIIARLWQDGTYPTASEGLPLKDGGVIEIIGRECVENLRIISADDRPHIIQVQYFS